MLLDISSRGNLLIFVVCHNNPVCYYCYNTEQYCDATSKTYRLEMHKEM